MIRSLINFTATILVAWFFASMGMDWWSAMLAGFISAYTVPLKGFKVFLVPFLAISLFWMVYAYVLSSSNDFILAKQIGVLLNIGDNPYLVIIITGLIGGIATGFSAIFGKQLKLFRTKK